MGWGELPAAGGSAAAAGAPRVSATAVFDEAAIADAPADWAVGEALPLESAAAVALG